MKGNPNLKPRKQRRAEAKAAGKPFEPIYNGFAPVTTTDYTKYDGKYVKVSDKINEETRKGGE